MEELIGQSIDGRFRVDAFLAAGGMGAVYRGTQLSVDRTVAIKVIANHAKEQSAAVERFLREARSISKLQHPNIVGLIDFGQSRDLLYLVMEFVDGTSLADAIDRQHSNPAFVVEVLAQIASGLAEAHDNQLIHRDLKPDNVLIVRLASGALQVKVVDFGIARMGDFDSISVTGTVIGTPHYMSPEQAQGKTLDARSDLFSLGIVAYQMMTGRVPFDGTEPLPTMLKICHDALQPLRGALEDDQEWPDALIELVESLLEKAPDDRPQTAVEVLDRLTAIQRAESLEPPRITGDLSMREVAGPPLWATMPSDEVPQSSSLALDVTSEPNSVLEQQPEHDDLEDLALEIKPKAQWPVVFGVAAVVVVVGLAALLTVDQTPELGAESSDQTTAGQQPNEAPAAANEEAEVVDAGRSQDASPVENAAIEPDTGVSVKSEPELPAEAKSEKKVEPAGSKPPARTEPETSGTSDEPKGQTKENLEWLKSPRD